MTNTTNNTTQVAENTTTNATASHTMPVPGNPIVLLLGVSALAGGYAVLRKKRLNDYYSLKVPVKTSTSHHFLLTHYF